MEIVLLIIIAALVIALVCVNFRRKMIEATLGAVMWYLDDEGLSFSELSPERKEYYIEKGFEML